MKSSLAFALAWAVLVVLTTVARADEPSLQDAARSSDPLVAADALYRMAQAEDAAGAYASAVEHYRAAVTRLPSFRYAPKAMTRAALLDSHAEGDYRPFARLESVRLDPRASDDPAAIDALAHDAQSFPPGPTRGEAWMVCAEAYVSRLHRRADGEAALRRVIDDPKADMLLRRQAAAQLLNALIDDGDIDGARDLANADAKLLDPKLARRIVVAVRRHWMRLGSLADVALFCLLTAAAVAGAARRNALDRVRLALRRSAWFMIAFGAYVALTGGVLASAYETGNAEPFVVFGAALVPIAILARVWGAAGSGSLPARVVRATVCASVVFAAAFLTLETVNVQYLDGFNL